MKKLYIFITSFILAFCIILNTNISFGNDIQTYNMAYADEVVSFEPETAPNSTFSVQFIDVGQADAALVECDGHYMLIDGGNKEDSQIIYSILSQRAVPKFDIVVATHVHEDHLGGLPGAYNFTTADLTLCPSTYYDSIPFSDFKKYADLKGNGITVPAVGNTYKLGSADVIVIGVNSGQEINDTSIVIKINYGETSFLFTGDAESSAEQIILNSGYNLASTVLKVGHHGSNTSTSESFFNAISPKYAVISVGENNAYSFPTNEVLNRLKNAETTLFRTDLQGDIKCVSNGKEVTFTVAKNPLAEVYNATVPTVVQQTQATSTAVTVTPIPQEVKKDIPAQTELINEYIGNINSLKFHYTYCKSVKNMNESNKYYYKGTRNEIINKGYQPCKNCNP